MLSVLITWTVSVHHVWILALFLDSSSDFWTDFHLCNPTIELTSSILHHPGQRFWSSCSGCQFNLLLFRVKNIWHFVYHSEGHYSLACRQESQEHLTSQMNQGTSLPLELPTSFLWLSQGSSLLHKFNNKASKRIKTIIPSSMTS